MESIIEKLHKLHDDDNIPSWSNWTLEEKKKLL